MTKNDIVITLDVLAGATCAEVSSRLRPYPVSQQRVSQVVRRVLANALPYVPASVRSDDALSTAQKRAAVARLLAASPLEGTPEYFYYYERWDDRRIFRGSRT